MNSLDDHDAGLQAIGLSRSENRKSLSRQDMSSETGVWTGRVRQLEHDAPRAAKGTRVSLHHSSQATSRCSLTQIVVPWLQQIASMAASPPSQIAARRSLRFATLKVGTVW
jgi:hypothetical protein